MQGDVLLDRKAQHHLLVVPCRMMVSSNMLAGYNVLQNLETSHCEREIMDSCTQCDAMAGSSLDTCTIVR